MNPFGFKNSIASVWILVKSLNGFFNIINLGDLMKYYQRLRDLREDHDLLQEDIAEKLGTTRQQYNRYETGQRELPMHHFITLANFYNVSLDYLAGLIDHPRMLKGKKQSEIHKKIAENSKYNPIFHYLRRYEETPKRKNIKETTWLKKFEI